MTTLKNPPLQGVSIACFESRRAQEAGSLLSQYGAKACCAPILREVPLPSQGDVKRFGEQLLSGAVDAIIFFTGIGTRILLDQLKQSFPSADIQKSFKKITLICRGPKPVLALKDFGIEGALVVPEPCTSNEIIEFLELGEATILSPGKTIAIQESGEPASFLERKLSARGCEVLPLSVYKWDFPEDLGPAQKALQGILEEKFQAILFTNANQVKKLFELAKQTGKEKDLGKKLQAFLIGSIGIHTTEALEAEGLKNIWQSSKSNLKDFIEEFCLCWKKKAEQPQKKVFFSLPSEERESIRSKVRQSLFMKACRREPTPQTPVWLMRQAGRYMQEYRHLRDKMSFLELCKNSDLAAEVTLFAADKINADAAIIFSDILLIVESMGLPLRYGAGEGPEIPDKVDSERTIDQLREIQPEDMAPTLEALSIARRGLPESKALLGFCGAPFTLASYILEGGSSKLFLKTKKFMYSEPLAWHKLMAKLSRGLGAFLNAQINAGADAVQIFDSWVGCLSSEEYREYVFPHIQKLIQSVQQEIPVIHFGTGNPTLLRDMREAGGDVIGIDFRIELREGWKWVGFDRAVQGNLDPAVLCTNISMIEKKAAAILDQAVGVPGHIFNLGHGVLPPTPVEHVQHLVDFVRQYSQKKCKL